VLDRLLDEQPDRPHDRPVSATEAAARLRRAVHRDLEGLLNARRPWRTVPAGCPALQLSPVAYGLPDIAAGAFDDRRQREATRAEIEDILRRFEPRFAEVHVHLTGDNSPLRSTLQLRIEALLMVDPAPEPISFDTTIETATSAVVLRPREDA
jgi:type VI secretion system protein ImpF